VLEKQQDFARRTPEIISMPSAFVGLRAAHQNAASVLYRLGRFDESRAQYNEAVRLDPEPET